MCGIAGILRWDDDVADSESLRRMIQSIKHRGPDDTGLYTHGPVGLAHARLSIVDLAGGHQPLCNEDGTVWVTFNGELFNYPELRAQLIAKGHVFRTSSDTEVIVHAYEERGAGCVELFNGQWAFALWDARQRRLVISRDRLGVRPVFLSRNQHRIAFASEVKALFTLPDVPRGLDLTGLDELFTFWSVVPPRTVFQGIEELPPGHTMVIEQGRSRVSRYWKPSYAPDPHLPEEEHAERLREAIVDATRIRLRADVPVGAYLSGGLDSTVIAAIVRKYTGARLKTFSVTFEDAEFDESSFQAEVIRHLEVDHQQVPCSNEDIGRVFPAMIWHAESPTVRTAPAPLFMLSQLVRSSDIKVVLTGEGSDELLGGYDIFKEAKIRRFWAAHPDSRLRPLLLRRLYSYMPALQSQPDAYLRSFFHVRPEDLASPFFSHLPRWEVTSRIKLFYAADVQALLSGFDAKEALLSTLPEQYSDWHPFLQAQYLETSNLLPGYLLSTQGDRVAMAHSVEGRYPFLDPRVVEVASRLPPRLKMRALNEKYLLKKAMKDLLPPFLRRRPKQPYRAPDVLPFFDPERGRARFEWVDEVCSPASLSRAGIFDPDAVAKLMAKARQGRALGARDGMAVVAILSTQLLFEQLIRQPPGSGPSL